MEVEHHNLLPTGKCINYELKLDFFLLIQVNCAFYGRKNCDKFLISDRHGAVEQRLSVKAVASLIPTGEVNYYCLN